MDNTGEFAKVVPWRPARTGNYETDCAQGKTYFQELRDYVQATGNPAVLNRVLASQVRSGVWDGVEIGFAQGMAEAVLLA